ncbi:phage tail tape measure protein [Photobacterium leiognathi subsp. mandapamensis]|uniref:phage tail tape measure protein n=1 Tax=Photobacterium leiognathi TaxID=553611 RepID=UPI003AF3A88C
MSLPAPLMFQVGLIDKITKPLGNIQRQFKDVGRQYRDGTGDMVAGAAGVAGAGFALQAALMPAIEMDRALGEVKALGVADEALDKVAKTALGFSIKYGQSAVEVVKNSEMITQAMGKMPGHVLASVTKSSSVLAVAMKSDGETVSRYMKNLYGNYKTQADAMGKDVWAAQVAGMTAELKRLYGTNMDQLEGMVDGMHSLTSSLGVGIPEQLAVLGMLNTQMSEGDAVTQYTNYLEGAIKAQEKLGVSLVDSKGNLLPMLQVLEKIKPLIKGMSGIQARAFLDDAGLGDGSLMLMNMIENVDQLKVGINSLQNVKGLDAATKMASTMTDQWQRLEQGLNSIRIAFGYAVLPSVLEVVSVMSDWAQDIVKLTQFLPNITKHIGYMVIGFFGLVAAGGIATLTMGLWKQAMVACMVVGKAWAGINFLLAKGMATLRAAVFAANLVIAANPIVLIVAAVVAAIAAIGALVYYWDDLKASFGDTVWFTILDGAINGLMAPFQTLFSLVQAGIQMVSMGWQMVKASFADAAWFQALSVVVSLVTIPFQAMFEAVKGGWQWVMSGFTDTSGFDGLFALIDTLKNAYGAAFNWISQQLGKMWAMAKKVIDWIPGMGGDDAPKSQTLPHATPRLSVPEGGAAQSIANHTQSSQTHYGGVNIYAQQMHNPQDFAREMEMVAG